MNSVRFRQFRRVARRLLNRGRVLLLARTRRPRAKAAMSLSRQKPKTPRLRGSIDYVKGRTLSGWLTDISKPRRRVRLHAFAPDGTVVAETIANLPRKDLLAAGLGDGRYGFRMTVDALPDGDLEIELRDAVTGFKLGEANLEAKQAVQDAPVAPADTTKDVPRFGDRCSGTIIFVVQDMEGIGGAEVLRALGTWLLASTKYEVRFVSMQDGLHREVFAETAPVFCLADHKGDDAAKIQRLLGEFAGPKVTGLLVDSIAGTGFFGFWDRPTPTVGYVHQLPGGGALGVGDLEFLNRRCSTVLARSSVRAALCDKYGVREDQCVAIPGLADSPRLVKAADRGKAEAREALAIDLGALVVVGCGRASTMDLSSRFKEIAARTSERLHKPCHFLWIAGETLTDASAASVHGMASDTDTASDAGVIGSALQAADLILLSSAKGALLQQDLIVAAGTLPTRNVESASALAEILGTELGVGLPAADVSSTVERILAWSADSAGADSDREAALHGDQLGFMASSAGPFVLDVLRRTMGVPPHVSVIVPNYNYERFLGQRLASIYGQTFQDFEVILLDDASSDGSAHLLLDCARSRPATRAIINDANSGSPFVQWLRGLEAARASLIWIAEADDHCEPELLEALVPSLDDRNAFLAHAKSVPVGADNQVLGDYADLYLNRISKDRWSRSYTTSDHVEIDAALAVANAIPNASAVVFRRFDPEPEFRAEVSAMRMCGDWYFYLRALRGGNIAFNGRPLNYHRRHNSTVTKQTEGSQKYFDELATTRAYVNRTYRVSDATRRRAVDFTDQDLARFGITDAERRKAIKNATSLSEVAKKDRPSLLVVTSDLSPGGGQMFAIRLANAWMRSGGRSVLLNVGKYADHDRVLSKIDSRVAVFDARKPGFSLAKLIADYDIDIVHSSIWWSDRFVHEHLRDLPDCVAWVVTTHGCYETLLENPSTDPSFPARFPEILQRVDQWGYLADRNLRVFHVHGRPERLAKVSNGYEVETPRLLERSELGLRPEALSALLASRAIAEKGWYEAVKAVTLLNERGVAVDLMLAGEGPVAERLRAEGIPPYVHLYGHVDNVEDYIAVADIGLLPSYFISESMPLVVIEMLAQGKPVVASSAGDIPSMLTRAEETAGVIVPLADKRIRVDALADAIHSLAEPQARDKAGRLARSIYDERFTMKVMIEAYGKLYDECLARRNRKSVTETNS